MVSAACSGLVQPERAQCRARLGRDLQRTWLEQRVWQDDQDSARQTDLWLGIFGVNWRMLANPAMLAEQVQTIRHHQQGSFSELLVAMVQDPALQVMLNGPGNRRDNPNENLARELLELFSLGEGHYSEIDVREAARALTGFRLDHNQQLVLDPARHDSGPKTILGRTAAFDAPGLALWLCEQPATARHISTRLWRRMIGTAPPPQHLAQLARRWRQQNLSLPWLMEQLLTSPEAVDSRRRGLRLSDPIEMIVRSLRLLGSRHPEAISTALRGLASMGQPPFEPPSVKGWPINEQWLQLRWLEGRRRTLQALLSNEEIWDARQLPPQLSPELTALPPLSLSLPAPPTRDNLSLLFADPVWQLA